MWKYGLNFREEWLAEKLKSFSIGELKKKCIENYVDSAQVSMDFKIASIFRVLEIEMCVEGWKSEQVENEIEVYLRGLWLEGVRCSVREDRLVLNDEYQNHGIETLWFFDQKFIALCRVIVRASKEDLIRIYQAIVTYGDGRASFDDYEEELTKLGYFHYCEEFYRKEREARK